MIAKQHIHHKKSIFQKKTRYTLLPENMKESSRTSTSKMKIN